MDTSDGPGGGYRGGGYQGQSRGRGGFGGGGRSGGGRGYYDSSGGGYSNQGGGRGFDNSYQGGGSNYQGRGGGYYDPGPGRGGGGGRGGRGYDNGYQQQGGGAYQQGGGGRGGGYQQQGGSGGYQGRGDGGGGRFQDGGGGRSRGFGRGRGQHTWVNPGYQKRQYQQQQTLSLPPNLSLVKTIAAHSQAVTAMAYDPGANALFTGSKDGKIKQWDCSSGQAVHEETLGGHVDSILYVQGFLFVAFRKGGASAQLAEGIINVYNTAAGKTQMIPGHRGSINQLMAANSLLFSCGSDCSIRVWGMEGEAFVLKQILDKDKGGHTSPTQSMDMVGAFLISGDAAGTIKVWDSASGTCTQTIDKAHAGIISTILPYGNNLLTGSADGTMRVWELVNPPAPGFVLKPTAIDTFFGNDEDGASDRGGGGRGGGYRQPPANAILTMDGTPDNKGESILCVSKLHDQGVALYNVDQNMALLGALPQVPLCRAITSIPGAAIIAGDDKGQVHIYSWV